MSDMSHGTLNSWLGALFGRSRKDYSSMLTDVTGSSVLMAVILWIVRRWPEASLYLEKKNGDAVYDHPMLTALNKPNQYYSGTVLWFGVMMSFVWDGNGYMVKIRNKRDLSVREYWYVPHFQMEPKVRDGSQSFVDYYEYKPYGMNPIPIHPEDVIHFRYGLDPHNPRKGFAPLKAVARDAATDEEADSFAASLLHNMGVPGLVISPDVSAGQVANFDVDVVKKYVMDKTSGEHRGEPLVNKGPVKVQQFGFDPKALDLSSLRSIPEERVAAVTGVPAAVVGFGSGLAQTKVGATMKELREMAYEDAIIPIQRLIAPEIQTHILSEYEPNPEDWEVKFDISQVRVLQEDQDALYKRTAEAFNGGLISREEGRKDLGFETTDADKIRRVPFSVTEVPDGLTLDEIDALNPAPIVPATPAEPGAGSKSSRIAVKGRRESAFANLQRKAEERHHAAYVPELADGFKAIADRVVKAYEDYAERTQLNARKPDSVKADPIDPGSPEGLEIMTEAMQIKASADAEGPLSNELAWKGHYLAVTKTTMYNMEAIFGVKFDLVDPIQSAVIAKGGRHFALVGVDQQTQDGIFKALAQGRTEGLGPRDIARQIRYNVEGTGMYPGVAKEAEDRALARGWSAEKAQAAGDKAARQYRAEVISRTETKYAQNVSTLESAKGSGTFNALMVTDGVFGHPRSGDVDIEANGQIISFESADAVINDEHPNGTLSLTPVIVEPSEIEEPLLGR
jgi:HK97 family phage portal protein